YQRIHILPESSSRSPPETICVVNVLPRSIDRKSKPHTKLSTHVSESYRQREAPGATTTGASVAERGRGAARYRVRPRSHHEEWTVQLDQGRHRRLQQGPHAPVLAVPVRGVRKADRHQGGPAGRRLELDRPAGDHDDPEQPAAGRAEPERVLQLCEGR